MVGFTTLFTLGLSTLALAAPAEDIEKRAGQTFVDKVRDGQISDNAASLRKTNSSMT